MKLAFIIGVSYAVACAGQQPALSPDAAPVDSRFLDLSCLTDPVKRKVEDALGKRDFKLAETILVKQINEDPGSADVLKLAARVFLADRDPMNAAIASKKADKIRPLDPDSRFALALAFVGIGKPDWARSELTALSQSNASNFLYEYWLGRLDYDARLYDSAVRRFRKTTSMSPRFSRGWDNLALALEGQGQLDEAVQSYRQAVDLNRNERAPSPWPGLNLGILLTKLDHPAEAEPLLREALRYDSGLATAHYRLGVNLDRQGRNAEAIAELQKAAELAPADPDPLYILGRIYAKQGESAKAAHEFARFRELKKVKRGEPVPPANPE